jgi:predicted enzyme related to lactoylglutathione lyase
MVAGMMEAPAEAGDMPPARTIYVAVDDADATAAANRDARGTILTEPAHNPRPRRIAVAADPQGARFGVLQPEPMPDGGAGGAFDQKAEGHGHWHELMSGDPKAGFDFYAGLFGWTRSQAMVMGAMGTYQLFAHDGADIGGMMGLGKAPGPMWLPYFGVNGIERAKARIEAAGGKVVHGPADVPGGAFIVVAEDPQGAHFAVVGPKEVAA